MRRSDQQHQDTLRLMYLFIVANMSIVCTKGLVKGKKINCFFSCFHILNFYFTREIKFNVSFYYVV